MTNLALRATALETIEAEVIPSDVIVASLKKRAAVKSAAELFKNAYMNGDPKDLTAEEKRYIKRDLRRYYRSRKLPSYIWRAHDEATA